MKLNQTYFYNRDKQPCTTFNPDCAVPEKNLIMILPQKRLEFPVGVPYWTNKCKEMSEA